MKEEIEVNRQHCFIATVATGLAGVSSVQAGVYTDLASFNAAIGTTKYTETFSTLSDSGLGQSQSFSNGVYSYATTTTAMALLSFTLGSDRYLTTSGRPTTMWSAPITITFTSNNVTAIGGSFFYTSAFGYVTDGTVTLAFSDGTTKTFSGQSNSTFWGYTSDVVLTSVTFTPDATHHFVSIDNLVVGSAAVPEPATLGMLGLAMLGISNLRRKS